MHKQNGDHLCEEAIEQEMKNSRVAFQACDGDIKDLIGHGQITCHLMFDIKPSECFRRKARFVVDNHKVSTSPSMSHRTVASKDSVKTIWTSLFLSADDQETHYLIAGSEFRRARKERSLQW